MQNDYNKCFKQLQTTDFLEFHVVESFLEITQEELNSIEQYHILKTMEDKNCYNFVKKVSLKEKITFSHTPEQTSELLSISSKKVWKNSPKERKEKLIIFSKELRIKDSTYQRRLVDAATQKRIKPFKVTSPDGTIYEGINQTEFCRTHGLVSTIFNGMVRGKHQHHKGWRLTSVVGNTPFDPNWKPEYINDLMTKFRVISPDGIIYEDSNRLKFAMEHNLERTGLSKMILGKNKSHKGWKLAPSHKDSNNQKE